MAKLIWYRWWPGAIPQIERVSPSVRGLAHAVMDHLWAHPEEGRACEEVLGELMLPYANADLEVLTRMFPLLVGFIESERKDHEEHRLAKAEAGRKGGLAKASSAKQSQAALSDAVAQPSPSFHPSILPSNQGIKEKESCPKPPKASTDQTPVVMQVPCVGGDKTWNLHQSKLDEWAEAYPGVDVPGEVRKAIQWLRDNPTKQKTAGGLPAYFSRWLSKAQNSTSQASSQSVQRKRTWKADESFSAQLANYKPATIEVK